MAKSTINFSLIKQAVSQQMNALRQSTSHTKTRGEVSGGGKKPWRQKGTGRARAGSSRSPIWVGGGITFGPRNERNFKTLLPKKMALKAKAELFALLKQEDRVISADSLHLKETKTKLAVKLLADLGITNKKCLLVTMQMEPELILSTANIPGVSVQVFDHISILDLANHQIVVIEKPGFDRIYSPVKNAKPAEIKAETKKTEQPTDKPVTPKSVKKPAVKKVAKN